MSIDPTHQDAPYDVVRPVRCMGTDKKTGFDCTRRHGSINWNQPGLIESWRCEKCGTQNVVRIVAARIN
jgi:hypothetical protein